VVGFLTIFKFILLDGHIKDVGLCLLVAVPRDLSHVANTIGTPAALVNEERSIEDRPLPQRLRAFSA